MNKVTIIGALLFASLAANVLCGGMLIGKQLPVEEKKNMATIIASFPEPQRDEARAVAKQDRPQIKELSETLRKTRQDAFTFVAGNDYDRAKAEEHFKQLRDQTTALQQLVHKMVLDIADKLSPAQRAELLQNRVEQDSNSQP